MSPRVIICGGPGTARASLAARIGGEHGMVLRSTDELVGMKWGEDSKLAATWFDEPGAWVCEGCGAVRAVRKWLASHPTGLPADYFMWLTVSQVPLTPRQAGLAKACATIWNGILPELKKRGATIFTDTTGESL